MYLSLYYYCFLLYLDGFFDGTQVETNIRNLDIINAFQQIIRLNDEHEKYINILFPTEHYDIIAGTNILILLEIRCLCYYII